MDANKISSVAVMKDGISKGMFEITGILETGELTITLLNDVEKEYLGKVLNSNKSNKVKLQCVNKLIATRGRPAKELLQVYKQNVCEEGKRNKKNGLRLR